MKKIFFFICILSFFITNNLLAQDLIKELEELKKLYNQGIITQEEFTKAKRKVIGLDDKKTKVTKKEPSKKKKITKKKASLNVLGPDIEGLFFLLEEANERGEEIDYDVASKQYGFKNFKDFVKIYASEYEIENLTVKQAKEFIKSTDTSVEIVESQENLDKLHSLIFNNKHFKKYQKKKSSYLKVFEKGEYDGKKFDRMSLAVYINYEKEMAKITKNPNLKEISRFTWDWGYAWGSGSPNSYALSGCKKSAEKYKLFGGECILVDLAIKKTNKHINLLKPRLKDSGQTIAKKNVKKIPIDFNPVTVEDHITLLGTFSKPTRYPEGMLKEIGLGHKAFDNRAKIGAQKMSLLFKRTDEYNQRHPGKMFHALAYFELFYQYQLKKKKKKIDRFLKDWPQKKRGGKHIVTLLKFNKARKKMREALGMDLNASTEEAMETFWALGDYLEKGKVVKQKVHPDIKIRKKLLSKYKTKVSAFNAKLEEEKDNKIYEQIYIPRKRKFTLSKLRKKES